MMAAIGLMLFAATLSSCKKDNEDKVEIPEELVGTWSLKSMKIGVIETSVDQLKEDCEDAYDEMTGVFHYGEKIEIKDDGTGKFKGVSVKIEVKGSALTMTDGEGYRLNMSWIIYKNDLILTLNVKQMFLDDDEFTSDEKAYITANLKQFTIDFVYGK
jgi:hypothetical protein